MAAQRGSKLARTLEGQFEAMPDKELLQAMFDHANEVSRITHQLDRLALSLDRLMVEAGSRWQPEIYDAIEAEEIAQLRCCGGRR